jgi:hypothetical protein
VVSEPLTADAQRVDAVRLPRNPPARPHHSSLRLISGSFDEFPFRQTTSFGKEDALPPSNPHTGIDHARAQYASPIPRSDAHNIVAANGQVIRLLCGEGCKLSAAANIWFELDTGQDPGWRMMSSKPAIADRDSPALLVRRVTPNTGRRRNSRTSRDLLKAYSMLKGGEPFPGRTRESAPSGACAAA